MAMQHLGRSKTVVKRSGKYLEEALYHRLFKEGSSELSVRQQLNQFFKSSKRVYKWEVDDTLKKLRDRKLYYPALKLSETMQKQGMNKTVSDQAIHLDLVAKAKGITAAENYFVTLPETSKNHLTYGALLNCYCKELLTEKAEALIEKMKELNIPLSSMSYNSLMTLYSKISLHDKIPLLLQEMKAESIMPDSYTYNVWIRALAAGKDISGVERVIEEMKRDGRVDADWTTYSNLASIYVDSGLFDKAQSALEELERRNGRKDLSAYQFLITLYGRIGKLQEVYRVWRSLRLAFRKTANVSYLNMIQVLVNLKDLPGAEKLFREWESSCLTYDIRIVNTLIRAYTNEGSVEKAQELTEKARRKGAKANAKTWEIFSHYYLKNGDIKQTIDCLEKAISIGKGDGGKWVPSKDMIMTLMSHFEQERDVDGAEGFVTVLKKAVENVSQDVYESLIRTYAAAGRTTPVMRRLLKASNVEVNDATKKLLDEICVE